MEITRKTTNVFVGLILISVCNAFPINLDASPAEFHSQFLTGLIGVLLTVCGVVCLVGCLWCPRHRGFKEFHNAPVLASSSSSLDHGLTNPITNGEFTIFTPLSSQQQNNVFLAHEQVHSAIDANQGEGDIRSWFDGPQFDFPRTKLKYIRELGKGWFGRVVEGTAQGVEGNEQTWTPVAVRILESSATNSERAVFLHDARIYRSTTTHPYILKLLGWSLQSIPWLLLQELCPKGDLKKYLLEHKGTPEKILNSELPLLWCYQLSSALKHLHDNQLTHPDLGSRNCQIVSDLTLKLGDYGLAASLYPEDYYQGAPAVPVRWCAPESISYTSSTIQPKQITCEGNVWSFGVTMWEIFECGSQPYAHLTDDEVISHVLGSATVRLSVPRFTLLYTNYLYRLMQLCWSSYEQRPSITQVHLMLADLLQVYQNTKDIPNNEPFISVQDFDKRWSTFKPNTIIRTDNYQFNLEESKSEMDDDINDISVLNLKLDKDVKKMSPSLNNLHGSLDNLTGSEMDSWLQNLATKTGDMSYVRGLSEAFNDLDNTLAMENVSSSDSSYLPSPAPEKFSNCMNKLEFKLGPTETTFNFNKDLDKTQNSSLTESTQRTSSESETEDETWRRKVEQGAYSEKVHQKSKSVTDLMVLTHIDCSESESETPLPSLDYRVNYKNVRYAPMQNLENVSLMFGSEGNLLSVRDKFQEELKRLQEERKDSLLFVPESSFSDYKSEETDDTFCTTNVPSNIPQEQTSYSVNTSPCHHNPESLIEELSSPTKIQPGNQVYNIFNVSVDTRFRPNLNDIIFESTKPSCSEESSQRFQVPKLVDIIQNNDSLMDYIISRYESQSDLEYCVDEAKAMPVHQVQFDTSLTQDKLLPSSMTHSAVCSNNTYILEEDLEFSSDFGNNVEYNDEYEEKQTDIDLKYSLETWNNFLGDRLNDAREYSSSLVSFPSESLSYIEEFKATLDGNEHTSTNLSPEMLDIENEDNNIIHNWEPQEGWFLHPQTNLDVSGQLDTQTVGDAECDVRFGMDDEVMAALRNELLLKLPQAQGPSAELVRDYEECDTEERNEIHIKYNVYTTPLSPIPEESYSECDSCYYICNKEDSSDTECDDEWPAPFEEQHSNVGVVEVHSVDNIDNGHTPSQDSCCSNDTLFNLEELTCGINDIENVKERSGCEAVKILKEAIKTENLTTKTISGSTNIDVWNICEIHNSFAERMADSIIVNHWSEHSSIKDNSTFLVGNLHDKSTNAVVVSNISRNKYNLVDGDITDSYNCQNHIYSKNGNSNLHIYDDSQKNKVSSYLEIGRINGITLKQEDQNNENDSKKSNKDILSIESNRSDINQNDNTAFDWELTHKTNIDSCYEYIDDYEKYSYDCNGSVDDKTYISESDIHDNNPDIVVALNFKNISNGIDVNKTSQTQIIENGSHEVVRNFDYITEFLDCERKSVECHKDNSDIKVNTIKNLQPQYASIVHEEHLYDMVDPASSDYDMYDVLNDIRFSGPADIQLMSTSFSESADVDEQDWDSGSDTRSSSSGEFIWKEGEHEESVKALRAAPQLENVLEKTEPLDNIEEINSETSDEDEDMNSPEFIPSAWDKYATPSKSALRSPEKTLERSEVQRTKPKGVWFKKQKYHCVYEYPKEPESPVISHYELWQPPTKSVLDWEVDTSPFIPNYDGSTYSQFDLVNPSRTDDLYQLDKPTSDLSTSDDDFYISSTAKPFEAFTGLSQFFPGASNHWDDQIKSNDNITPDSGIEDATPSNEFSHYKVPTLKILAAMALKQNNVNVIKNNTAALGGLRHARNKLKLDLPPSPSAFSYTKVFTLEAPEEPVTRNEVPTFTTFGKSRFSVQQVDTLCSDQNGCKNVSFEAIPYKPIKTDKSKVEIVRGEASLLDSADEDSGIESSTLAAN